MAVIEVDDQVYRVVCRAAPGGDLNQGLRGLLGLAPGGTGPSADPNAPGELDGLIAAGLIAPEEKLFATSPVRGPHPVATVTDDGRLYDAHGVVYPGPAQLLRALRGGTFAPYGWQCLTTADGRCLATVRQRWIAETAPHLLPSGPGALTPLITAGLLGPGDQLRLPMYASSDNRTSGSVAVGTATVSAIGWFLLPDGARYPNPSAAAAAYRGNPTNAWAGWVGPDGRRLAALRELARANQNPR